MVFEVGEYVLYKGIRCKIHHFNEEGFEAVSWLEGYPTALGMWERASLHQLDKIGSKHSFLGLYRRGDCVKSQSGAEYIITKMPNIEFPYYRGMRIGDVEKREVAFFEDEIGAIED